MKYLLDTNVVSELRKSNGNTKVKAFIRNIHNENLYISVVTIGEVAIGIKKLDNRKKSAELTVWLENGLMGWFENRILPIDVDTMLQWGNLQLHVKRTLPIMDSLIAATALADGLTLVTRNTKDFADCKDLLLINPWEL